MKRQRIAATGVAALASKRACIKVPSGADKSERAVYEQMEAQNRRILWTRYVLGEKGVYVGRPKNDGGWFQVPEVKQGSFLANPYPLKDYGIEKSLELYEEYVRARLREDSTVEDVIKLLPLAEQKSAALFYLTHVGEGKGKSTKHYELDVIGEEFKERLLKLKGFTLGCFCEPSSPCHTDVLLRLIEELTESE